MKKKRVKVKEKEKEKQVLSLLGRAAVPKAVKRVTLSDLYIRFNRIVVSGLTSRRYQGVILSVVQLIPSI